MEFKKLIQHIQIPKGFIQTLWINPSILLKELLDKEQFLLGSKKMEEEDFFFHEKKHIFINTALPRWKFDTARKKLEELWLIEVKLWEWKKMFFKINNSNLNELFFPQADSEFAKKLFLEYVLEDWYVFYPKVLAHKIWINETIFIKSLLSKRKYFEKLWKVKNWYFFNSVSNVKTDTWLSKDQQLKVIKTLVKLELLDVQLAKDNTRYFCINDDKLIDFENIDIEKLLNIEESKKTFKLERWFSADTKSYKIAEFKNPFNKKESEKISDSESWIIANLESKIFDNIESENPFDLKVKNLTNRKLDNIWEESKKADINKTKNIILNNNIKKNNTQPASSQVENKLLLLFLEEFWLSTKNALKLISKYSEENILKNIKQINLDEKIMNKAWFLIKSLEEEYNFINIKFEKEEKIKKQKSNLEKNKFFEEEKNNIEKQKQSFYNKLLDDWIIKNCRQYKEIFEEEKNKFLETSSNIKNPDILIKSKVNSFIKKNILYI